MRTGWSTPWVPPESILGEEAVAALRTVPRAAAGKVIRELDAIALSVEKAATAAAGRGPIDPESADLDGLPHPPEFFGLVPRTDEELSVTVQRFCPRCRPSGGTTRWRPCMTYLSPLRSVTP